MPRPCPALRKPATETATENRLGTRKFGNHSQERIQAWNCKGGIVGTIFTGKLKLNWIAAGQNRVAYGNLQSSGFILAWTGPGLWSGKTTGFCRDGMPFRAHSIYFLYLLAHFSFYFQQIHFQTFFHLPSLLLSCCFFCTQAGNLFWKRYFNVSRSQQSFCLLAHLYLNTSVHHRVQLENTMRYFHPPESSEPNAARLMQYAYPLKPNSKKSILLCWERRQGGKQHRNHVKMWNKQYLWHGWFSYQKRKLKNLTVFQLRLTRPEN